MDKVNAKEYLAKTGEAVKIDGLLPKQHRFEIGGLYIRLSEMVNTDAFLSNYQADRIDGAIPMINKQRDPARAFNMLILATYVNSCK